MFRFKVQNIEKLHMIFCSGTAEQLEEVQEGDAIQVGHSEESVSLPPTSPEGAEKVLAAPAVRRIASEYKVDLKNVQGTGRDGRVLKEDIMAYVNSKGQQAPSPISSRPVTVSTTPSVPSATPPSRAAPKTPLVSKAVPDKKEPIKGYTKTMIKTMTAANVCEYCELICSKLKYKDFCTGKLNYI
jgi:2-oxoisovalerate dehydrogenase E2 component (dihydrolipoyl transacylase)